MKIILIGIICFALSSCGDNPFSDNSKINGDDYASIRLEIERCNHVDKEGSFSASMRFSPRMSCLKHLKTRIIGNSNKNIMDDIR